MDKVSVKQQRFVDEWIKDRNASRAYRVAYDCVTMSDKVVGKRAGELRNDPKIVALIDKMLERAQDGVLKNVKDVLNEFAMIATADVSEVVQYRRLNCRYCHGKEHQYKWKDEREYQLACDAQEEANRERGRMRPKRGPLPMPSDAGGYGYRFNMTPHPECPDCLGEGKGDVYIADTTKLKGPARRLVAGIKRTQHGVEIKMRDQSAALELVGKMLGGFKTTFVHENPDGTPMKATATPVVPMDPIEAARVYAEFLKGSKAK